MARAKLTRTLVRESVCPAGRTKLDLFDTQQAGFLLEVRQSGGKTFYQRYTDAHGHTRQYKIGSASIIGLSAAKRKGRTILAEALIGDDPRTQRKTIRSIPTLTQFVRDRYLPHAKNSKLSWRTDETVLRIHILPALGSIYLDQLQSDAISALVSRMLSNGYATGTTNRVVIVLRRIFNLARKWHIPGAQENPAAGIKIAPDVNRERFLTKEELERLLPAIREDENTLAANAIMLLLLTGARRNEITQARWEQVDWNQEILLVPRSKSGKARTISLSDTAIELLKGITPVANNPYIFPSPTTGRPSPSLYFPWNRIRIRAGLVDLRLHDLRHSFASFLANRDVSLYRIQKALGHSSSRYTQRYAHLAPKTMKDAAEIVAEIVGGGKPPERDC